MTVNGPVEPSALGVTLTHEHVLVDLRHSLSKFDAILDDEELVLLWGPDHAGRLILCRWRSG